MNHLVAIIVYVAISGVVYEILNQQGRPRSVAALFAIFWMPAVLLAPFAAVLILVFEAMRAIVRAIYG